MNGAGMSSRPIRLRGNSEVPLCGHCHSAIFVNVGGVFGDLLSFSQPSREMGDRLKVNVDRQEQRHRAPLQAVLLALVAMAMLPAVSHAETVIGATGSGAGQVSAPRGL